MTETARPLRHTASILKPAFFQLPRQAFDRASQHPPAIHSAAITTKLVQVLGGVTVVGPILFGLAGSVQICRLGDSVSNIITCPPSPPSRSVGTEVGRRALRRLSGVWPTATDDDVNHRRRSRRSIWDTRSNRDRLKRDHHKPL